MNVLMGKRFYSRAAIVVSMVSACAFGDALEEERTYHVFRRQSGSQSGSYRA